MKMKAAVSKKKKVGGGGFDRSKLNPSFFNNSKTSKDKVQGWAFDFDNPDAGKTGGNIPDDDAVMQSVMAESIKVV